VWEANSRIASVFLGALCVSVANPFFSYYCELFVVAKKVIRLGIRNFRTLLQKHPGWGVSIHDKTGFPITFSMEFPAKRRQRAALFAESRAVATFQFRNHYLHEAALC
jgi:hypothetical protein